VRLWCISTALALAVGLAGCGDARQAPAAGPTTTAREIEPLRLPDAAIPGTPQPGAFVSEDGRPVMDVTSMARGGAPGYEFQVLLGRGPDSVPCFAVAAVEKPSRELHCFEAWERPSFVVRAVATKKGFGVAGIADDQISRVALTRQTGNNTNVELVGTAAYPWRAFTRLTPQSNMANELVAYDADDEPVDSVEVSWAYSDGCDETSECGAQPTVGDVEVRDPIALASGTSGEKELAIAFADPAVRQLAAGHSYTVTPIARWDSCLGDVIGAVITLVFHPPMSFSGEIPVNKYPEEGDGRAYRTGRAHAEGDGITAVDIAVDTKAAKVVGIDLQAFDKTSRDDESPAQVDLDMLKEPTPAGPVDDMSCYDDTD
jgi:hypothetical protein